MPTPFYHLALANELLAGSLLSSDACNWLNEQHGPFLFGNIAPDVQSVSGQLRHATHFFQVPMPTYAPAWVAMFAEHPQLAQAAKLDCAHAAFIAGYLAHLLLDQMWIIHILEPVFVHTNGWKDRHERFFWHNVFRVYLDRRDLPSLIGPTGAAIAAAQPNGWLPFEKDRYLVEWRDFLAGQLEPGAPVHTVEVFAQRMRRSPLDFEQALDSPEAMQQHLFDRWPPAAMAAFRQRALTLTASALDWYLAGAQGEWPGQIG